MVFTHDIEEWLREVDLWTQRESEDLIAALQQGQSVGMFEFAFSDNRQQGFVMTAHTNCVLILRSPQARQDLAVRLMHSLDGDWDSDGLMSLFPTSASARRHTGNSSRLM